MSNNKQADLPRAVIQGSTKQTIEAELPRVVDTMQQTMQAGLTLSQAATKAKTSEGTERL